MLKIQRLKLIVQKLRKKKSRGRRDKLTADPYEMVLKTVQTSIKVLNVSSLRISFLTHC